MTQEQYDKLQAQLDLWAEYYKQNKIADKYYKSSYGENQYEFFRDTKTSKKSK